MKILFTSQHCILGGAETFMLSLSTALQSWGHECELFFFKHGPFEPYIPTTAVVHFGDLADCLKLVRQRRFDVVHARSSDWIMGVSAVRDVGAKLIVTSHGFVPAGWNSATCDALVVCARWLAAEQGAVSDLPIQVALNGVDTDRFSPGPPVAATSPPIVAWVGRGIEARKHLDTFAAISVFLKQAGMRLWVIDPYGPEALESAFPDAARTLRATTDFWGPAPLETMPSRYRQIAASGGCVVSTASWEGLPLTLLEAQACGCPVIGPDVHGTNECVDPGRGGTLFPLEITPPELANLVLATLADTERLSWQRSACADFVSERFSVMRMARDYVTIYDATARARRNTWPALVRSWRTLRAAGRSERFVQRRWTVGHLQYDASARLAQEGEWALAHTAARASLEMSPRIYLRPKRLALLIKAHVSAARDQTRQGVNAS